MRMGTALAGARQMDRSSLVIARSEVLVAVLELSFEGPSTVPVRVQHGGSFRKTLGGLFLC